MRRLRHLVRRFLWTLRARPLSPRDQAEVEALLRPAERELFWAQPHVDQRHGLEGARAILIARPGQRTVARAALLHDIGKRHARLGVIGRSLASGLELFGLKLPIARWQAYWNHGRIGAAELEAAAAEEVVAQWARHHQRSRPQSIDATDWELLKDVDTA